MTRHRILIVEDDEKLAKLYRQHLGPDEFEVYEVASGLEALTLARQQAYDLILLDISLTGGMDGFQVLRELRQLDVQSRILIISGHGRDEEIARGLELEADNYLVKPVSRIEFIARVRAELRQGAQQRGEDHDGQSFLYGSLVIVSRDERVYLTTEGAPDTEVSLGLYESKLLIYLMKQPGKFISLMELARQIWDSREFNEVVTGNIRNCIFRVRQKLDQYRKSVGANATSDILVSIRNQGIMLRQPDKILR